MREGNAGLDPPAAPGCDGGSNYRGLGNWRAARRHRSSHDRSLGHRCADDADSSYPCWS